ncbi:MAG TPA: cbb3-type cytochrome c oxidase subunit I [Candidatus Limnocylindria bacterium]|nr:cbb3-type cytochrome c oxidase subunit I [Candidatus Limnocylindria bacterium]
MSANLKKLRPYDQAPRTRRELVPNAPDSAATLWLAVAVVWFVVATGLGALWLLQEIFPQATFTWHAAFPFNLKIWVVLQPDRMLAGFVNAVVYGWLTNAAIGAIWFITPRVTGRPLVSNLGANVALGLWNLAVLLGLATIFMGILPDHGLLSEFTLPVDALGVLAILMVNGVFWGSVARGLGPSTYISVLYFGIGLLAFLGLFTLNAALELITFADPWPLLLNDAYARALEAYWLLGAAVGTLYYVVPRASGNPLYSGGLALLGWLTWLVLSIVAALAALVDPSVPYLLTTLGSVGTMLLLLPAFLVTANLLLTLRGRWSLLLRFGGLSMALIALAFLVMATIIQAIGGLRSVIAYTGATEWAVGALVYTGLGTYTFAFLALGAHAFPRLLRRASGFGSLTDAAQWLTFAGVAIAGAGLMFSGIAHGSLLAQAAGPDVIASTLVWFRLGAVAGMGLLALGALAFLLDLFLMYTAGEPAVYVTTAPPPDAAATPATS